MQMYTLCVVEMCKQEIFAENSKGTQGAKLRRRCRRRHRRRYQIEFVQSECEHGAA